MTEIGRALTALLGEGSVFEDEEALTSHAYDWWPVAAKWRGQGKTPLRPEVVVRPQRVEAVGQVVAWAAEHRVSITPWGAGSSVTGAPLPLHGGITLDLSALNKTLEINETDLAVTVEAGRMGHELEAELNARGYTLNHSPQSLDRSTVGGWLSTRATGQFSSRWGGIEDLVVGFEVVLPNGQTVKFASGPRMAVGPDLRHLFMGAEGTMGVITRATLKIFRLAPQRIFETVVFKSLEEGLGVMHEIMQRGLRPFLVRYYNPAEARHALKDNAIADWVMFLGFEGERTVAEAEFHVAKSIWEPFALCTLGPIPVERWMDRRFDFSTVENLLKMPGGLAETIEVAHFWGGIEETYHRLVETLAPFADEVLGHFSHVYPQGTSLYIILLGERATDEDAETALLEIWQTAMRVCMDTGAALSHHHGVGVARMGFVSEALGSAMPVLTLVKQALDPADLFCPGKLGITYPEYRAAPFP